jgi:hypothetical protein
LLTQILVAGLRNGYESLKVPWQSSWCTYISHLLQIARRLCSFAKHIVIRII